MRISDWSSDVCSSDLVEERVRQAGGIRGLGFGGFRAIWGRSGGAGGGRRGGVRGCLVHVRSRNGRSSGLCCHCGLLTVGAHEDPHPTARTSVVYGKSGSERVARGGSRIIKTKT